MCCLIANESLLLIDIFTVVQAAWAGDSHGSSRVAGNSRKVVVAATSSNEGTSHASCDKRASPVAVDLHRGDTQRSYASLLYLNVTLTRSFISFVLFPHALCEWRFCLSIVCICLRYKIAYVTCAPWRSTLPCFSCTLTEFAMKNCVFTIERMYHILFGTCRARRSTGIKRFVVEVRSNGEGGDRDLAIVTRQRLCALKSRYR